MKNFDVNEFRSHIQKSYHRTAHFNMITGVPNGLRSGLSTENAEYFKNAADTLMFDIESVNLPGFAVGTEENRRYGIGPFSLKPYTPIFDTLNLVVRSDSSGRVYDFWQSWMKLIINFDARVSIDDSIGLGSGSFGGAGRGYDVSYKNDYSVLSEINVYDAEGNDPTIHLYMLDSFPTHIGNAQLDWHDNNILRFPVTMTFSNWYQQKEFKSSSPST